MAEQEVKLRITTDASGAITGMKKVTDEMNRMKMSSSSISAMIKKHWVSITAAVTSMYGAWNLAEMAAGFQEQKDSLNRLAVHYGTTADAIISDVQRASKGMLGMRDVVNVAGDAMMKGFGPDKLRNLAEAAETISNIRGGMVSETYAALVESLATGKTRGLKQLVGIMELETRYTDKQLSNMSELEKADARYVMLLEKVDDLQKKVGDSGESTADKMEKLRIQVDDLKIAIGDGLIRVAAGAYGAFSWLAAGLLGIVTAGNQLMALLNKASSYSPNLPKSFRDALASEAERYSKQAELSREEAGKLIEQAMKNFDLATSAEKLSTKGIKPEPPGAGKPKLPKDSSDAQIDWIKKIESLNPVIDRYDKQLQQLEEDAAKLVNEHGRQKWILDGLTKGKYYINLAQEMEETKKVLEALYETEKRYQELAQTWDLRKTDLSAQTARTTLDRERMMLEEQSRYGLVSSAEQVEKQLDLDRRTLEIDHKRMLSVIAIKSINAETEEQMTEINGLAYELRDLEQQIADLEDVRLLRLREYTGTFTEGVQSGMAQYTASLESNFQRGVRIAEDTASAMTDGFNSFFDHTSDGFLDLANLARNVGNDVYKSMVESLISKPLAAGLGTFVTGLLGGGSSPAVVDAGALVLNAHGNVFSTPGLSPYLNTVVSRPTAFAFEHGVGFFGEKGRPGEAVMPLIRTKSGDLGVRSEGNSGSSVQVSVIVNNNTGQPASARQQTTQVNAQETIVTLWLDALDRDAFGLKRALGG